MTKQIEDYPELDQVNSEWIDTNTKSAGNFNGFEYVIHFKAVGQRLLFMQQRIDELTEQNKELQERVIELEEELFAGYELLNKESK